MSIQYMEAHGSGQGKTGGHAVSGKQRLRRIGADGTRPTRRLAPAVGSPRPSLLVIIVVVMVRMIDVIVVAIVPVIGHRVSDGRAAKAADDRAHRAADRSADGGPAERSTHGAAFVGKGELSRGADEQRRCESKNSLGHLGLLKFGRQWRTQCRPSLNAGGPLKFPGAAGRAKPGPRDPRGPGPQSPPIHLFMGASPLARIGLVEIEDERQNAADHKHSRDYHQRCLLHAVSGWRAIAVRGRHYSE